MTKVNFLVYLGIIFYIIPFTSMIVKWNAPSFFSTIGMIILIIGIIITILNNIN